MVVFTVGTMTRVLILVIMLSAIWTVLNQEAHGMRGTQHQAMLEDIARDVQYKLINAYEFIKNNNTEYQTRVSLPVSDTEYSVSISCENDSLKVTAQDPAYYRSFVAVSNINCSLVSVNGSVSWGERCLIASNNGTKKISLVNTCAPV